MELGVSHCYYVLYDDGAAWYYEFEPRENGQRYGCVVKSGDSDNTLMKDAEVTVPLLSDEEKQEIRGKCEMLYRRHVIWIVGGHH